MNEQYKFKDILIGFRNEYLLMEEKLKSIENDIKILDDSLIKAKILLEPNTSSIACYFLEQKKNIFLKLILIQKEYGNLFYNLDNIYLDPNISSFYHFKNDIEHFHIIIENIEKFNNKILSVFNSEFLASMEQTELQQSFNDKTYLLDFNYNHLTEEVTSKNSLIRDFSYYPYKDFIKINYSKKINQYILDSLILDNRYNKSLFNKYQQQIIEKANPFDKKVVLFEDTDFGLNFSIIEEEKRLILKRQ